MMWSTTAMQDRHDQRVENIVATLERVKQEHMDRYKPVKEAFWWRVRIGDGLQTIGRCYTETEAQRLAAELQRAFNDGAFCVEKVVCNGDLIGAAMQDPSAQQQEFECPRCGHCCPTQRKPLTVEEIKPWCDANHIIFGAYTRDFIRAIEAAHGIK